MFDMHVVSVINTKPDVLLTATLSTDRPCPLRTGRRVWRVPPDRLLSPDSLVFGYFQLLIIADLYKEQDQLGRPRIKTKNQLNPDVRETKKFAI